ncbi:MAG: biopolymer transporter ExbD [Dysgonamonadaceae bacterium]|nr:biopolymer transporter ExbD [Dysgonamonadaceae bacterium]MDD3728657.1 biopolymer transporter ExbD [Dysgonamonadaceae bacterium]
MGKFNKSGGREMPALNTASLPDMIFAILFFFMVTTTMREVTLMVKFKVPDASEIQKLEKKSLVTYIYMGQPIDTKFGTGTFMQLNDKFAEVEDIHDYIAQERNMLNEQDQQYMTVSLKVDEDTQMRYVTEVKQALRRAYALKISYSARKRDN